MAFNFISVPAELRNMVYAQYLTDDISAVDYFNEQVQSARLHVPELARAYRPQPPGSPIPDIYNEVLVYFYDRITATMDLRNRRMFWDQWSLSTVTNAFLAHLRKFEIIVPRLVCNGFTHAKIFIDLNNTTNPVSCGDDQPEVHIPGCACIGPYTAAMTAIDAIVQQGQNGGALVMTKDKLREIFRVVYAI